MLKNSERETFIHHRKIIQALVDCDIFLEGPYTTSAGARSPVAGYIERITAFPKPYRKIIKEMAKYLRRLGVDCIIGCEMIGVPIGMAIAYELKIPFCVLRKDKTEHGVITNFAGTIPDDVQNIALFDDWNGGWGSFKKFYGVCQEYDIKPKYIVAMIETFEEENIRKIAQQFLLENNLHAHIFCTFRDIVEEYLKRNLINSEAYPLLSQFVENPDSYLKSDANINKYLELKKQGKTFINIRPKTKLESKFEIK